MRHLAFLAALSIAACAPGPEGQVVMLDASYGPEVIGTAAHGFAAPDGLLWHEGALIVADEGGSTVRRWRPGERAQNLAGPESGLVSPEDLIVDRAGNILFTDDDAGGVRRIGRDGRIIWLTPPDRLTSTEAIGLSPGGLIIAGDGQRSRIAVIGGGGQMDFLGGPIARIRKPESFAFDGEGNLYIADNRDDILYLLTRDGRLHRPIAGRAGFSPESLSYREGILYITDSRNHALYRYTPGDGLQAIAAFTGDLANVQGVTLDGAGNIYLSVQADLAARRGYILRLRRTR